jgi:hypothetical protein
MFLSLLAAADNQQYHQTFTKMIAAANQQRARHGLQPVQPVPGLMDSSAKHTIQMVRTRNLTHSSYRVAEIIAAGQRTAEEVVLDWMRSPGHRSVMLGNYKYVGAAAYMPTGGGTRYWTMQFSNVAYGTGNKQAQQSDQSGLNRIPGIGQSVQQNRPRQYVQPRQYSWPGSRGGYSRGSS